jgi:hypothetical protein
MVLKTWIFSGSRKVVDQRKRWVYTINPHFSDWRKVVLQNLDFFSGSRKVVEQKKKSEFEEPLFYTFLEKWLQIKWLSAKLTGCFYQFVVSLFYSQNIKKIIGPSNDCDHPNLIMLKIVGFFRGDTIDGSQCMYCPIL